MGRLRESIGEETLQQVFQLSFSLVHQLGEHVATEYWSTCKDIEYWRRVADAGDWEAYYITYFQQGPGKLYRHVLSLLSGHSGVNYSSQGSSSSAMTLLTRVLAIRKIIVMKASLTRLARLLALLQAVGEELKGVFSRTLTANSGTDCQPVQESSQGMPRGLGSLLRRSLSITAPPLPPTQSCFALVPPMEESNPSGADGDPEVAMASKELTRAFLSLLRVMEVLHYHSHKEDVADRLSEVWSGEGEYFQVPLVTMLDKARGAARLFEIKFRSRVGQVLSYDSVS